MCPAHTVAASPAHTVSHSPTTRAANEAAQVTLTASLTTLPDDVEVFSGVKDFVGDGLEEERDAVSLDGVVQLPVRVVVVFLQLLLVERLVLLNQELPSRQQPNRVRSSI